MKNSNYTPLPFSDMPIDISESARKVENWFNTLTEKNWEFMGLADRRLVCDLRSQLLDSQKRERRMREALLEIRALSNPYDDELVICNKALLDKVQPESA